MPHEREILQATLAELPLNERLAHLACSCLVDNPRMSVELLVDLAAVLARHLPQSEHARICWHLSEVASELKARARWN